MLLILWWHIARSEDLLARSEESQVLYDYLHCVIPFIWTASVRSPFALEALFAQGRAFASVSTSVEKDCGRPFFSSSSDSISLRKYLQVIRHLIWYAAPSSEQQVAGLLSERDRCSISHEKTALTYAFLLLLCLSVAVPEVNLLILL